MDNSNFLTNLNRTFQLFKKDKIQPATLCTMVLPTFVRITQTSLTSKISARAKSGLNKKMVYITQQ